LPMDLELKFKEEIEKIEEEEKMPYISTIERMGIEKGIEQGIEKGIEKGKKQRNIELAKRFLSLGVDINIIAKASGMSEEEIKKLMN
jgi:predicted transposase/invertase (TIGR01784 family)